MVSGKLSVHERQAVSPVSFQVVVGFLHILPRLATFPAWDILSSLSAPGSMELGPLWATVYFVTDTWEQLSLSSHAERVWLVQSAASDWSF